MRGGAMCHYPTRTYFTKSRQERQEVFVSVFMGRRFCCLLLLARNELRRELREGGSLNDVRTARRGTGLMKVARILSDKMPCTVGFEVCFF